MFNVDTNKLMKSLVSIYFLFLYNCCLYCVSWILLSENGHYCHEYENKLSPIFEKNVCRIL
jgi:hypothetical protein